MSAMLLLLIVSFVATATAVPHCEESGVAHNPNAPILRPGVHVRRDLKVIQNGDPSLGTGIDALPSDSDLASFSLEDSQSSSVDSEEPPERVSATAGRELRNYGLLRRRGGQKRQPPGQVTLTPYQDELPIPTTIDVTRAKGGSDPDLTMGVHSVKWKFHKDLPSTSVYAFGKTAATASVPGPTIIAASDVTLTVKWFNNITDSSHLLPVDTTLGAPDIATNGVPFVPHLHGAHVHSTSDGYPDAWFSAKGTNGASYSSTLYTYYSTQPAATMWYHDHTVGITRLNVAAGLYGMFILKDAAVERKFRLPLGKFQVPLVFQDKTFLADGSMKGDTQGSVPTVHPYWVPESLGDMATVNGKVNPYMTVHRRKYFFRLLNANPARFLFLSLNFTTAGAVTSQLTFQQVMSDGGYLASPVSHSSLLITPGQRMGIVVDFSRLPLSVTSVLLVNNASSPYPGPNLPPTQVATIMKFKVRRRPVVDLSRVPRTLATIPAAQPSLAVNYPRGRDIALTQTDDVTTKRPLTFQIEKSMWTDAVTIKPVYGTAEVWNLINPTGVTHPVHVHFVPHRVISRRKFNVGAYDSGKCSFDDGSCYSQGAAEDPDANEMGWMDTTRAPPGYVTTILLNFTLLDYGRGQLFDPKTGPGYVIHCHILDHEDNDMMRPWKMV